MALSGTFKNNFRTGYGIEVDWSATQSVTNNTSTITAKVYWCSYGSSYTVSSSATKSVSTTIDGTTGSTSGAGLASLSGNQRKLIHTYSKTVTHNSDGTKSASIKATFSCEVTLGGTYYSSVSVSGTASLNTIPRKSTLSDTTPDFTAGSDINITVSRYSSSFTHKLYIDIADSAGTYTNIKSIDFGSNLTMSTGFSVAEKEIIFSKLNGRASTSLRYNLHTYSGGTDIGYNTYYGTATAPSASTISSFTPEVAGDYQSNGIYVDQTTTFNITRGDTEFIHTLEIYVGSTKVHTKTGVTTSYAWTPTSTEMDIIYNAMTTVNEIDGKILVYTYYNGATDRLVRSATEVDINFHVRNSNPTFTSSQIGYKDGSTNPSISAITGNDQYIVQGKSTVTASLLSLATGVNKATITKYEFTLNGVTKTLTAVGDLDFGVMNASTDLTLSVKVTDSRGNSTTVTKTVTIVPYKEPVVTTSAKRTNNYEDETTITLSGSIYLVPVGTTPVNKNSISYMQYRYKELTATTWGSWTDFAYTMSGANYTATSVKLTLDNQKAYSIEVKTQDKFVTTTVAMTVAVGQPIFFVDSVKKSVGVNMFPTANESLEVDGMFKVKGGSKGYVNFNNTALVANDNSANGAQDGTNYDHIWHDDTNNAWHFASDATFKATGNSTLVGANFKMGQAGGKILSAYNGTDYEVLRDYNNGNVTLSATGGTLYVGYANTTLAQVNPAMTVNGLTSLKGGLDMVNADIKNVNHITINDTGGSEGIEWLDGTNNWKIVVSPDDGSNASGPLQVFRNGVRMFTFGTTGTFYSTGAIYAQNNDGVMGNIQHQGGYMIVKPYDSSYGTGHGRIWYDSNNNMFRFWNQANGNATLSSANTSKREYKTDILEVSESALDKINSAPVYEYFYKRDTEIWKPINENDPQSEWVFTGQYKDKSTMKKKRGIMVEEAPPEIVVGEDTIDLYGMSSILWKAVQELSSQVKYLQEKIKRR